MAIFPNRNLKQWAVYWGDPVPDGTGGYTFDTPAEIRCRWLSMKKLLVSLAGEELVSNATVQVSEDLDENGMLFLGRLSGLSIAQKADPRLVDGAYFIKQFHKIPTMSGRRFVRKAYLAPR